MSKPIPIPDIINAEHEDLANAKRVLLYGKTAGGQYVPVFLNADGSLGGLDEKYVNVTGDTMSGPLKIYTDNAEAFIVGDSGLNAVFGVNTSTGNVGVQGVLGVSDRLYLNAAAPAGIFTIASTFDTTMYNKAINMDYAYSGTSNTLHGIWNYVSLNVQPSASIHTITGIESRGQFTYAGDNGKGLRVEGSNSLGYMLVINNGVTGTSNVIGSVSDAQSYVVAIGTFSGTNNSVSHWCKEPTQVMTGGTQKKLSAVYSGDVLLSSNKKLYLEGSYNGQALTIGDTYMVYDSTGSTVDLFVNNTEVQNYSSTLAETKVDHVYVGTGTGLPYGSIKISDNTTATTISASGTYVQVNFDTNGESNLTTPDHTNDHITITKTGKYLITCSIDAHDMGVNHQYEFAVRLNNGATTLDGGLRMHTFATNANQEDCITLNGIRTLTANDTVELWVKNNTATDDITTEFCELSVVMVGG